MECLVRHTLRNYANCPYDYRRILEKTVYYGKNNLMISLLIKESYNLRIVFLSKTVPSDSLGNAETWKGSGPIFSKSPQQQKD